MKKTLKSVVALIFCMTIIASTMVFAFAAVGKVTNAKATSITYNSATLTWSKASSADGYEIYQYKSSKWTKIATTTATSYKLTGLTTGTTYKYRIRGYDKGLLKTTYGAYTATISVKPLPAKVTGLTATGVTAKTIKLAWTKVAGATGYVVQQYKGGKWVNIKTTTATSYTVSSLTLGTSYSFRVRAYRKVGSTNHYSSAYSATVKGTTIVPVPTGLTVSDETATQAKISWKAVSGATGYQLYNYSTKKWTTTGAKTYLTVKSLKAGTQYQVTVRAYQKVGSKNYYSKNAAKYSFTTAPAAVASVSATKVTADTISVSWAASAGAKGYQVYLYDYNTKTSKRVAATTATSYNVSVPTPGARYRIAVRAYGKNVSYTYSGYKYLYVTAAPKISAGEGTSATNVNVTWTPVYGAKTYTLEKYEPLKYSWTKLIENTAETSYSEALAENKAVLYRVTAYNGTTEVAQATGEVATTGITLAKGANNVKVTWKKPAFTENGKAVAVGRYAVYKVPLQGYSTLSYQIHDFDIADTSVNSYNFNLTPNECHSYMIYAYPKSETATPSSVKVAEFTVTSGDLVINSTDASKTAQLQTLVNAINKTKLEKNKVTVTMNSTVEMNLESIFLEGNIDILGGNLTGEELILWLALKSALGTDNVIDGKDLEDFLKKLEGDGSDMPASTHTKETFSETLTFENGSAMNDKNKNVLLKSYIEPTASGNKLAYLYDEHNAAAWKNGFSSVSTKKYADGSYLIVANLKQEKYGTSTKKDQAYYHPGFSSTFDAFNFAEGDGVENRLSTLGATKITASINADGTLKSLQLDSPFTTTIVTSPLKDSNLAIGMKTTGTTNIKYSFAR